MTAPAQSPLTRLSDNDPRRSTAHTDAGQPTLSGHTDAGDRRATPDLGAGGNAHAPAYTLIQDGRGRKAICPAGLEGEFHGIWTVLETPVSLATARRRVRPLPLYIHYPPIRLEPDCPDGPECLMHDAWSKGNSWKVGDPGNAENLASPPQPPPSVHTHAVDRRPHRD